jgi:hypothetical protein
MVSGMVNFVLAADRTAAEDDPPLVGGVFPLAGKSQGAVEVGCGAVQLDGDPQPLARQTLGLRLGQCGEGMRADGDHG